MKTFLIFPKTEPYQKQNKTKKSTLKKSSIYLREWIFVTLRLKNFLYFWRLNLALFHSAQAQGIKKFTPRKFLMLQETETPKKILRSSQKKAFLIFIKMETPKKIYISENGFFLYSRKKICRTLP